MTGAWSGSWAPAEEYVPQRRKRQWNTLSELKLVAYIRRNPGLTATMLARLWKRRPGHVSSLLYQLAKDGKIARRLEQGERSLRIKSWRYYARREELT